MCQYILTKKQEIKMPCDWNLRINMVYESLIVKYSREQILEEIKFSEDNYEASLKKDASIELKKSIYFKMTELLNPIEYIEHIDQINKIND